MGKSWVAGKGYAGLDEDVKEHAPNFGPRRFWLAPSKTTQIAFVDDDPVRYMEHQVCLDGSWQNYATCSGDDCPLCAIGDKPSYVGVWTIVDRSEYTDKKGQKHKDEVRLFAAKSTVMTKLARRSEAAKARGQKNGLAGLVFSVSRGDSKSASTGDDFELLGKGAKVVAGAEPIDYLTVLAPNTKKLNLFARRLSAARPDKREASSTDSDEYDDIPF